MGEKGPKQKKRRNGGDFIEDNGSRRATLYKRKIGIFKKAKQMSDLTGASVLVMIATPNGNVYSYGEGVLDSVRHNSIFQKIVEDTILEKAESQYDKAAATAALIKKKRQLEQSEEDEEGYDDDDGSSSDDDDDDNEAGEDDKD